MDFGGYCWCFLASHHLPLSSEAMVWHWSCRFWAPSFFNIFSFFFQLLDTPTSFFLCSYMKKISIWGQSENKEEKGNGPVYYLFPTFMMGISSEHGIWDGCVWCFFKFPFSEQ